MDARDAAAILAACSWLKKQIGIIEADAKPSLSLKSGETKIAELPTGQFDDDGNPVLATVAKVIMTQGRKSVEVNDWDELASWIGERWPEAIKVTVDPVWWAKRKSDIAKDGALYDSNGEVCPWIAVIQADGYTMTKLEKDVADEVMQRLLRGGAMRIQLDGEPQLSLEAPKPKGRTKK